ncbi:hypothetical protein FJY71_02450 [candidate division WOR-3 bacterium]|nr:hypothetical protein [candidate division WOR-3 bacterium]
MVRAGDLPDDIGGNRRPALDAPGELPHHHPGKHVPRDPGHHRHQRQRPHRDVRGRVRRGGHRRRRGRALGDPGHRR